jgi:AraC-like DNA-binding protein
MNTGQQDVVSQVLAACKADRAVTAAFTLRGDWALRSGGTEGALIRLCKGDPYWIRTAGAEPVEVRENDIVMLPRGTPHTVSALARPGVAARPFSDLLAAHMVGRHGDHPIELSHGAADARPATLLYALHLWLPLSGAATMPGELPPLIVLRADESPVATSLAAAMESIVRDSLAQRPGWRLSASRLGDLLLVHILGQYLDMVPPAQRTERSGLDHPGIARAIARMHEAPQQAWTVAALAGVALMSRTVFCERFGQLVGMTPMQYLAAHRMNLAAELLRQPHARIGDVAAAVGYGSDKAFDRSFRRRMGVSASQYQRQCKGTVPPA